MKHLPGKSESPKSESPEEGKGERLKAKGKKNARFDPVENNSASGSNRRENPTTEIKNKSDIENGEALNEVNPTAEIKELPTANLKLPTENTMEVHHHPEVEKKGFKEYILEGLMIFLAVTMGFFAESLRENITNNEHVKQLSVQLMQDLKTDTLYLQEGMSYESVLVKKNDSLFFLLQQPIAKTDTKKIQQLIFDCYNYFLFHQSSGAFTAIKSQLQLKQFSESQIAKYIADYEATLQILKALEKIQSDNLDRDLTPFFKLHFTPQNLYAFIHRKPLVNGDMRNLTQNDLTQLSMDMEMIQSFNNSMIFCQRDLKNKAVKFIKYIKKEYNLQDE